MLGIVLGAGLAAATLPALPAEDAAATAPGVVEVAKKQEGGRWQEACKEAARARGWSVRDVGPQRWFSGGEPSGKFQVSMRVRDGRHRFDVNCQAYPDGKVTLTKR